MRGRVQAVIWAVLVALALHGWYSREQQYARGYRDGLCLMESLELDASEAMRKVCAESPTPIVPRAQDDGQAPPVSEVWQ